jgi:uncharacterized membrane protein
VGGFGSATFNRLTGRVTVTRKLDETERFLLELADGLEALGPAGSREVLMEVRSHLAEAIAEQHGDERAALAQFGPADQLAKRILEERGILGIQPRLPEARSWRKILAILVDLLFWFFAVAILSVPFQYVVRERHTLHAGWIALASVYFAALVVGSGWWWLRPWLRSGYSTTGMHVMGIQQVGVGEQTRVVRTHDIPDTRVWTASRVISAVITVGFLVMLGWSLYGNLWTIPRDERLGMTNDIVSCASSAVSLVGSMYLGVLNHDPEATAYAFGPDAQVAASEIVKRHADGVLDSYAINDVSLPDYEWPRPHWNGGPGKTAVVVRVTEQGAGTDAWAQYEFRVVLAIPTDAAADVPRGWYIESVTQLH